MDAKEKRKQYYINNRDRIIERINSIITTIERKDKNIIMSIGLYMDIYTCKKEV